jgi:hypothetical protein
MRINLKRVLLATAVLAAVGLGTSSHAAAESTFGPRYQYSLGTQGESCGGACTTGYCCSISIE